MENLRMSTLLLVVGLGLFLIYLNKDFTAQRNTDISKSEMEEEREIRKSIQNISDVFFGPNCRENSSVTSIDGFSSLTPRIQLFFLYQHCRHFPMLLDVPDKCGGAEQSGKVFLLLVIKSSPGNYERREALRKTWAKERFYNGVRIQRLFISGTTGVGFHKVRQNKLLENEHNENNDILQWDFVDTFYNLTLKQMLFLEWFEKRCPKAHFLLNGDDDVFANSNTMVEFLQGLYHNDGTKHLFTGHPMIGHSPDRRPGAKYHVPVQLYEPGVYPPTCSGAGFLLSGYTAKVIYNMSKSIPMIPIDDAYFGLCLRKAGLRPVFHNGMRAAGMDIPDKIDEIDPCYYKEIMVVHRFLPAENYLMWHRVNDPNLKCAETKKLDNDNNTLWS